MNKQKHPHFTAKELAYTGLCVALIAICSWISIPSVVPFTLQTLGVFCTLGLLGGKRGTLTVFAYLLLGTVGVPVFAGFTGGPGVLFGATGGYLIGFLASALIYWLMVHVLGNSRIVRLGAMVAGLLGCYVVGTVWFIQVYSAANGAVQLMTALGWCVFPFIIPDLLKIALAMLLTERLSRHVQF